MRTQQHLADRMKVHVNTVGAWERDEAVPEGTTLARLLEILELTFEQLTVGDPRFNVASDKPPNSSKEEPSVDDLSEDMFRVMKRSGSYYSRDKRLAAIAKLMALVADDEKGDRDSNRSRFDQADDPQSGDYDQTRP